MILLRNFKFFTQANREIRLHGSRNTTELPPASLDKLRDHLYPRVATAKIYAMELSYYSSGEKNLDGQKAEKEVGDDRRARKKERMRDAA